MNITWNDKLFNAQLITESAQELAQVLVVVFTAEITSDKWVAYKSGQRDLVDTGALRDSLQEPQVQLQSNGNIVLSFDWAADYSLAVHEGYRLKNGAQMPAAPWTKEPQQGTVILDAFVRIAAGRLGL